MLDFLRDQPFGDGAALRSWLATTNPFADDDHGGVDLLTFHAAKGREWPTVVVTGVETGLVPAPLGHDERRPRRGGPAAARRRDPAADRLVLTWAARRGGYQRRPSPLIAGIDTGEVPLVAPPAELRTTPTRRDPALDALRAWRDRAALAAGILPDELCTDADLAAIAAARPATADELAAVTTLGALTAARLLPGIRAALDVAAR